MCLPVFGTLVIISAYWTNPRHIDTMLRELMIRPQFTCGECTQCIFTIGKCAYVRLEIGKDVNPAMVSILSTDHPKYGYAKKVLDRLFYNRHLLPIIATFDIF